MTVAILALQGAFAEHAATLDRLGVDHFEIRQPRDLERPFDGLILPGGESTVMGNLLRDLGLFQPLRDRIAAGLPVFGTCAGLILLAREVEGGVPCFATMDIAVRRNAYGRQLGSFYTEAPCKGVDIVPMTFIRAPYIASVSGSTQVLAAVDGRIVAARQGNQLVTAFHPELNEDTAIHSYFLWMIAERRRCA
ncbi:pyridoxal 5'-phosphate synthase glutaminase subunit PdxT [Dysosmobacter sp.]|uniref:pyridoxal 5'-phosphate synthase glutaminase subunit PdxT n=1 Tax=Dysosmobacter sp. TaxID=2591382 RepID=UPI002A89A8E1|nr:pyridoxal 5'-phosphate synthase glutaminase subunit PdxT [Dysosmobacter sp.]MDY3281664.1 pyridoxal 5'-phosphate synthase glutaminase subunit PdxT [Dysosmobacter sp.]